MNIQRTSTQCYCGAKATHWLARDDDGITARCDEHWDVYQAIASDLIRLVEASGGRVLAYGYIGVDIGHKLPRFAAADWVTDNKHQESFKTLVHQAIAGRWVPE
jgi:hypothetical protein